MIHSLISDCSLHFNWVQFCVYKRNTWHSFCVQDKGTIQIYVNIVETIADRNHVNSEPLHTWVIKAKQTAGFALRLLTSSRGILSMTSCGSVEPTDFLFHCLTTYRNRKSEDNNITHVRSFRGTDICVFSLHCFELVPVCLLPFLLPFHLLQTKKWHFAY